MEIEKTKSGSKGISSEFFIDNVEEEFFCSFCGMVLWMAKQASCGCRFCCPCIPFLDGECSLCKVEINQTEITDDFYARRRLRTKKMSCINIGCKVTFEYRDLDDHLKQCSFVKVKCMHYKSGCRTKIFRNQLKHHLDSECEYRLVSCQFCDYQIPLNELKNHNCVNKPMDCPNDCGSKAMPSEELNDHLRDDCPLEMISCQFAKLGCNIKFVRKDLENHQQDNANQHLLILSKKFEEQNFRNVKLGREKAELESKCELLRNKFDEMSSKLAKLQDIESEFKTFKEMTATMFKEMQKKMQASSQQFQEQIALLHQEQREQAQYIQELNAQTRRVQANNLQPRLGTPTRLDGEAQLNLMKVDISELQLKVSCLEETSYDGTILWRIPNIEMSTKEAISGKTTSLYSQPFYSSRYGYKMCLRLYLNGDGMGRNTHVSLFFVIMRGMYDALLPWPFNQNVTLILLDQETGQRSMSDSFHPDRNSSSFQRPKRNREMNIASGCPLFVSKGVLRDPTYVKDDTMYIRAIVEQIPSI